MNANDEWWDRNKSQTEHYKILDACNSGEIITAVNALEIHPLDASNSLKECLSAGKGE